MQFEEITAKYNEYLDNIHELLKPRLELVLKSGVTHIPSSRLPHLRFDSIQEESICFRDEQYGETIYHNLNIAYFTYDLDKVEQHLHQEKLYKKHREIQQQRDILASYTRSLARAEAELAELQSKEKENGE